MSKPEIRKFLDLSTGHLPRRLFGDQDHGAPEVGSAVAYPTEHGMFVWVPDDPQESSDAMEEQVPAELLQIQLFARKHGCDYILFDTDGPEYDELPVYEGGG